MQAPKKSSKPPLVSSTLAWRLIGASAGYLLLGAALQSSGMPPAAACWLSGLGVTAGMTLGTGPRGLGAWSWRERHARRLEQLARYCPDRARLGGMIVDAIRKASKADRLYLWLPPAGESSYHLTHALGPAPETLVIPEFTIREWLEEGTPKPRLVAKAGTRNPSVFDMLLFSLGADACLPLVLHGRLLGLITLSKRQARPTRMRDLQALQPLCAAAALALLPHQLENEQQLQVSKLEAVSRLYLDAQRKAVTDGLTGLITHAHFQEQLASRFFEARRYKQPMALMFIDIDHFKRINDTYGHQTGDEVLRQVSRVIQETVRSCDVAARYGGEEIAVLLPQTDLDGALILAERMREAISDLSVTDLRGQAMVTVTASLGVSELEDEDQAPADLISRADQAVYRAKHRGRNRVVPWTANLLV